MPQNIRFHIKSRKGCSNCKRRRVKCDELKPQCSSCLRRGAECLYTYARRSGASSTSIKTPSAEDCTGAQLHLAEPPSNASQYSDKSLLDLRLMHHYCVFTAPGFAGTFPEEVLHALQVNIPTLACQHLFLMDAILLVAMVHLCCTDAASIDCLPVYIYRDQALRGLRHATANISHNNIDAVRGASVLLAQVSFATDRVTKQTGLWVSNWMMLALGQRNFREPESSDYRHEQGIYSFRSSRYSSSNEAPASADVPIHIQRALAQEGHDDDTVSKSALRIAATEVGRLISIIQMPYERIYFEKQVKAWSFDRVSPEFNKMIQRGSAKALVILAYYLVIFKLLPSTWLYQDVANHDIEEIDKSLNLEWKEYISVPRMAVHIDNKEEVAQLLRSSFHDSPIKPS